MSDKTMEQLQSECRRVYGCFEEARKLILTHYQDGDWRRFKNNHGKPAYKFWSIFVKNEYHISKRFANNLLHAAIIEQELGLPEGMQIRESVLRVLWSVDRNIETNRIAYEIAHGIAAKQALAKGRKAMPITAKIMEKALLIACGKEPGYLLVELEEETAVEETVAA
jgi:2-hydroxychromene-2-carboxylate isomerase